MLFGLRLATAHEPFLPCPCCSIPWSAVGTATACFAMGTFIGLSIYVPVYFELALGLSASQSGVALIPLMGGVVAGASASGRLMAPAPPLQAAGRLGPGHRRGGVSARWPGDPLGLPLRLVEVLLAGSASASARCCR